MKARPQTTVAPLGPDRQRWRRQLAWLARAGGGERDPVVAAAAPAAAARRWSWRR